MTTETLLAKDTGSSVQNDVLAVARATVFLLLMLILALPAQIHAQDYTYKIDNGTITITGYIGSGGAVIIPGTLNGLPVTRIGDWVFIDCSSLTQVIIPSSVTSIGDGAFSGCFSLTQVTIPSSVIGIGDDAFSGCSSLTQVTIPNSVTSIGDGAFSVCSSLTQVTIPDRVTSIGKWTFYSCSSLTQVTIPNSVTNIGVFAFGGCDGLAAIQVEGLNEFYASLDGVLFDKSLTTLLQYPGGKAGSYTIPNCVTSIGNEAFRFSSRLTQVTIPDRVTSIGYGAFSSCVRLTQVTIPDRVTSIGEWAFSSCSSLTQVTIPNNVTNIESATFEGCGLINVTVGSGVANIGDSAFGYCDSLAGVFFQGNAPSLEGGNIFNGDNKATVYYLPGTTGWGATFGGRPAVLLVPQNSLRIGDFGILNGRFGFTIAGPSNVVSVVEASTNLADIVWSPVGTNTLTDGSSYFSDPEWANHPTRFYRLRWP